MHSPYRRRADGGAGGGVRGGRSSFAAKAAEGANWMGWLLNGGSCFSGAKTYEDTLG